MQERALAVPDAPRLLSGSSSIIRPPDKPAIAVAPISRSVSRRLINEVCVFIQSSFSAQARLENPIAFDRLPPEHAIRTKSVPIPRSSVCQQTVEFCQSHGLEPFKRNSM